MTKGLYTAAPTGPIWALGGSLLGKSEDHGDSGPIGNDKPGLFKAVPSLYVELRQSDPTVPSFSIFDPKIHLAI